MRNSLIHLLGTLPTEIVFKIAWKVDFFIEYSNPLALCQPKL